MLLLDSSAVTAEELEHAISQSQPIPAAKPERWAFILSGGGDIQLYQEPHQAMFGVQFGYDVIKRLWVLFAPEVKLNLTLTTVTVPVAVQYDFAVPKRNGLFLYPRIAFGYALSIIAFSSGAERFRSVQNYGTAAVILGLKYELNDRWIFGIEPIGAQVFFNRDGASAIYRVAGSVGIKF